MWPIQFLYHGGDTATSVIDIVVHDETHCSVLNSYNPNTFVGLVGKVQKNYLPKEEGREGGEKSARSAPAGPGAWTRNLPRARQGSPAARHGGCLDKQAFPCL